DRAAGAHDPGHVGHDVEAAVVGDRGVYHGFDIGSLADVGRNDHRLADHLQCLLEVLLIAVGQHQSSAGVGEGNGRCLSDATGGAGDDGNLAVDAELVD